MKSLRILSIGIVMVIGICSLMVAVNFGKTGRPVMQGQQGPPPPPPGPGGPRGPGGPGGPGRPGGPGGMDPRMMDQLGLSDTQREQIRALGDQARTESQAFQEQMKSIHDSIRQIVESKQFDEAAARVLTKQQAEIEGELAFIRLRTDAGIYRLLTDEQRAKLEQMRRQPPPPPPAPRPDQPETPRA